MQKPAGKTEPPSALEPNQASWRKDQTFYRSLLDSLSGFAYCRMIFAEGRPQDFVYLEVNRAFEQLTGLQAVAGKKVSEVIPGLRESDPQWLEIYGRVALSGQPERFESYLKSLDKWFSVSVSSPQKEYFLAVFDVITERKRIEASMQESNALLSLFMQHSPIFAYIKEVTRDASRVLVASENFREMVGIPGSVMQGKTMADLFPPDFAANLLRDDQTVVAKGEVLRVEEELDGRHYATVKFPIIHNGKSLLAGYTIDITERKRAEDALRASEARWKFAIEGAGDGLWDWDVPANLVFYSQRWKEMLGYAVDEIGSSVEEWSRRVRPEDLPQAMAAVNAHFDGQTASYVNEHRVRCKDGSWKWILARGLVISRDAAGKPLRVIGTHSDITERKRLEAQNRQLQKHESLGRMAGAIAHNFNNQLAVVMMSLGLIEKELPDSAFGGDCLSEAMQSVKKLAQISGQMLTYLGQSFAKRELLDLAAVCQRHLDTLQAAMPQTARLVVKLPASGPVIYANAGNLQEVLTSLLTNAWESGADRAVDIRLTLRQVAVAEIAGDNLFPLNRQPHHAAYACIEVADTGNGIAAADIEKIFDPFFTTKITGRGLGLAVVLGFLRENAGCLTVASVPGQGSTFRIFLPLAAAALKPKSVTAPPPVAPPPSGGGGTVLVVDDEPAVLKVACLVVKKLGYNVLSAQAGAEAVEIFRTHQAAISCVLCDLAMPNMDGWEVLQALRQLSPAIPVVLMSGYDEAHVMAEQHSRIPFTFLGKPYDIEKLKQTMNQVMPSHR